MAAEGQPALPPKGSHEWSVTEWLRHQGLHERVAEVLLAPILALSPPGLAQLTYLKGLTRSLCTARALSHKHFLAQHLSLLGRDDLHHLLHQSGLLDTLEEVLWNSVEELDQEGAATGAELAARFAVDADYGLQYGTLDVFFKGLEVVQRFRPRTSSLAPQTLRVPP